MREKPEEGGAGVVGAGAGPRLLGDLGDAPDQNGFEQLLLGGEMAVQRAHADPGLLGDDIDRHRDPLGGEDRLGGLEDPGAVA